LLLLLHAARFASEEKRDEDKREEEGVSSRRAVHPMT
jgi:hypothetical protein